MQRGAANMVQTEYTVRRSLLHKVIIVAAGQVLMWMHIFVLGTGTELAKSLRRVLVTWFAGWLHESDSVPSCGRNIQVVTKSVQVLLI